MGKGRPVKKDNSAQKNRTEANKVRKQLKYQTEREKRKGTKAENSRELSCVCGKNVKVNHYTIVKVIEGKETKDTGYKCSKCRGIHNDKKEEQNTSDSKSKNWRQGKGSFRKESKWQTVLGEKVLQSGNNKS